MFDPHSTEFQAALIAAYQGMMQRHSLTGEIEPAVILVHFGEGEGAPRYRAMSAEGWATSRGETGNAAWTPVASVEADGTVTRFL